MSSPYTCKKVRLRVTDEYDNIYVLDVVELAALEMYRQGQVEKKYGIVGETPDNRHRVGSKRATFRIRRWFKTEESDISFDEDDYDCDDFVCEGSLFYELFNDGETFELAEYVPAGTYGSFSGIILNDCKAYRYNLITGAANDIIGEEIIGEALNWEEEIYGHFYYEDFLTGEFFTGTETSF